MTSKADSPVEFVWGRGTGGSLPMGANLAIGTKARDGCVVVRAESALRRKKLGVGDVMFC